MEVIDNAIMLGVPSAMEAGLDSVLFWGALSFALAVAGVVAYPFNRWLIARGKGHAVVHATGIHGGPSPRVVGAIAVSRSCSASLSSLASWSAQTTAVMRPAGRTSR